MNPEKKEKLHEELLALPEEKRFQLFLVSEIAQMVIAAGFTHTKFGENVFGSSGGRIWRIVRQLDRRRSVSVPELYKMADLFKVSLPSLLWDISQKSKNIKWEEFVRAAIEKENEENEDANT